MTILKDIPAAQFNYLEGPMNFLDILKDPDYKLSISISTKTLNITHKRGYNLPEMWDTDWLIRIHDEFVVVPHEYMRKVKI